MVPLALYISVELVKLGQCYFISEDLELYYEPSDKRIQCRALNIPEDLGQVLYYRYLCEIVLSMYDL